MWTGSPEAGAGEGGPPLPSWEPAGPGSGEEAGEKDGPLASRPGSADLQPEARLLLRLDTHPSCQREGSTHLGQVELVADAKRL